MWNEPRTVDTRVSHLGNCSGNSSCVALPRASRPSAEPAGSCHGTGVVATAQFTFFPRRAVNLRSAAGKIADDPTAKRIDDH